MFSHAESPSSGEEYSDSDFEIATPPSSENSSPIPIENLQIDESKPAKVDYAHCDDYNEDSWNWLLISDENNFEVSRKIIRNDAKEIIGRELLIKKDNTTITTIQLEAQSYNYHVEAINDNCLVYSSGKLNRYKKNGADYNYDAPWKITFYDLDNKQELFSFETTKTKRYNSEKFADKFVYFYDKQIMIFNLVSKQIEKQWDYTAQKDMGTEKYPYMTSMLKDFIGFFQNRLLLRTYNGLELLPNNNSEITFKISERFDRMKIDADKIILVHAVPHMIIQHFLGDDDRTSVSEARSTITCYKYNSEKYQLELEKQWKLKHGLDNLTFTPNNLAVYSDLEILYALDLANPNATPKALYQLKPEEGGAQPRVNCFYMQVQQDELRIERTTSM